MKPLLLSILPRPPHPTRDGLAIRNYHLLKAIAAQFRVRAIALRAPHLPPGDYPGGVEAEEIAQSPRTARRAAAAVTSLLSRRAYSTLLYQSRGLERALARERSHSKPAWLFAHSYHVGSLALSAGGRSWIDFHNLDSQIWDRVAQTASSRASRWFARRQVPRVRALEECLAAGADGASCVSEPDARRLVGLAPGARPLVVPNGVDLSRYEFRSEPRSEKTVVFVGDLSWLPNADAVRWLRDEVWPLVRREQPEARAEILGREAPRDLRASSSEGFRFLGEGGDTRPVWETAAVAVVPLRSGGGTRLKILEAAACGVPVVATSVGAEGLALEPESEFLARDDAASFSRAICELLGDPQRRRSIARAARTRVERDYDWTTIGERLAEELRRRLP